jgi:hypothetical protein
VPPVVAPVVSIFGLRIVRNIGISRAVPTTINITRLGPGGITNAARARAVSLAQLCLRVIGIGLDGVIASRC